MNNQAFSKIWIVIIIVILLGGGFLAWRYLGVPKGEKISAPVEKIIEKKIKVGAGTATTEETVKIKEKEGEWNTLIMDKYLGYEVDYPKDWELYGEVGLIRGFVKSFEKDSTKIACSISITPIARESDFWGKSCAETRASWDSQYYPGKFETSPVTIGNTPTLKTVTDSKFPANIVYSFGPNPEVLGKWCFEAGLTTEKLTNKVYIEFGKNIMPECEEILNQILHTFKFIEPSEKPSISEIQTGKFEVDWNNINWFQKSVDEGAKSCLSDPLETLKCEGVRLDPIDFGFTSTDLKNPKRIFFDVIAGVAKYEVTHVLNGKTYIVTVVQPVPGTGKIWTISEIQEK